MFYFGFSSNMLHLIDTKTCYLYSKMFILLFILDMILVKLQLLMASTLILYTLIRYITLVGCNFCFLGVSFLYAYILAKVLEQ